VLAPLPVTLDVHDHPLALRQVLADHHVGHSLQRTQRLAAPADQRPEVAAADVEGDGVAARPHADLRAHPHVLQQPFDQALRRLGLAVGRCLCHPKRGCALVHDRDFDDCLLRRFAEDLDVDVAPALLELDQRRVDGLVQSSAAAFSGFHVRSLLAVHLLGFLCLFEPPGGPVLATLGAALFPMFGTALLGSAGAPPATVLNRAGSTLPHPTTKLC